MYSLFTDIYLLRRILDKNYVNKCIIYSGRQHSLNYIYFLIKYYSFEIVKIYHSEEKDINIIIYGKNSNDEKIFTKYKELRNLGFTNVYIYIGGMFMRLLLQDINGDDMFPTTNKCIDLLKYKETSRFHR